jgi:Ca2+-transporting ATPase
MLSEQSDLTSKEAKKRLKEFGKNVLPERPPPSDFLIFVSQLKNPLVYVLVIAGLITLFLKHTSDASIIFLAVLVNTVLGFFQERKANKALLALKKLIHPTAKVIRDGKLKTIDASRIVPGDVVVLNQGDKVPADGRLFETNRLFLNEAMLTGESESVVKEKGNRIFMGTIVSGGQGKFVVEKTGALTEMGKIAESVQEPAEETPLRRQLKKFSRELTFLVLGLSVFVFVVGLLTDRGVLELFTTSVALAVSAIPEGLLVGLTVVLAIGMQRILKSKGLVRNLTSAETLGGVTTICVDKTGTLTQGKMQVVEVLGDKEEIAEQMIAANDLNDPIEIAAHTWARQVAHSIEHIAKKHPRLDSIPFSSKDRFFAALNKWDESYHMVFVNGAPEVLVERVNLTKSQRSEIKGQIEKLTSRGKRVIGLIRKKVPLSANKLSSNLLKANFEWVGLLAFSDPVRPGVKEALKKIKSAEVSLMVITGDYAQTAISVMEQLGIQIDKDCLVLGSEVRKLSAKDLAKKLEKRHGIRLFARTTPGQKLKIVEALKKNGEIVAMTGDGINDAPALNSADIGIVVGEATDVAKEVADLVLLDSNFATIVAAIEEGRGIFDNLRKIILYLLSDAFEEIIAVIGALILKLPLPVTAAQILWINLVSDGFPDLALTVDPRAKGIMQRKPRSSQEGLVTAWMRFLILIVSFAGGTIALILFVYFYQTTKDLILARSIAFAVLGVNSLIYVFSIRVLTKPFWQQNPFVNKWLNLAVLGGLFLQIFPFLSDHGRDFFGLAVLSKEHWLIIFSASLFMFLIIESAKVIFARRLK